MPPTTPAGSDPATDAAIATALGVNRTAVTPSPALFQAPPVVTGSGITTVTPSHDEDGGDESDETGDEPGTDELTDAGKQALDRMKAKWRDERRRRITAERTANAATDADEQSRVRREAESAAITKANARILRAEVRAAAAGRLADPDDALAFIDLSVFEVDDDGGVDGDEIRVALDDLITRKPHLAAQGSKRTPQPDRSQGAADRDAALTTAQQFAHAMRDRL